MIGIITYNVSHRKTQDLVYRLILQGYSDLFLVVIPWIERENHIPIFKHRPSNPIPIMVDKLCEFLNLEYAKVNEIEQLLIKKQFKHILIGGAGLLPDNLVKKFKIINAHPGYLPNVKGLDALKWAIHEGQPIGVTTHYISEKPDEGQLIERRIIPVFFEDTFHSVANRVYETEIEMLVNAIQLIENNEATLENLADDKYKIHRRMPNYLEHQMMYMFDNLREKSKSYINYYFKK